MENIFQSEPTAHERIKETTKKEKQKSVRERTTHLGKSKEGPMAKTQSGICGVYKRSGEN